MSLPPAIHRFLQTLWQIGLITAIWFLATWLSSRWLHSVPAGILGIIIALVLLGLGLLRREWVASGATWLLREMLLFFVPVFVAIIQYPDLMKQHGLGILFVIVASTACVMVGTAIAVDMAWRLERRLRKSNTQEGENV
ncbi:CidA/LrgA family protein [Uliginosibacterium gangwonense]|uniref:CidA/LrgA family protein n=1 Tax=Uliginosibacterium gangwonense TaxID=392736 RepID=UPI000527D506|nr:CidA/LrgA family protein [Uliginosibacterium gangwonense]